MHNTHLEAFWLPFTDNKQFKQRPKMLSSAKGMYYYTQEGRKIIDGSAGLWCVNAGHGRSKIINAIKEQAQQMYYCPPFNLAHESAFVLANKLAELAPQSLNHVFFTNSGSESVDSALKIALAYQHAKGRKQKNKFIGRDKGYHGVGFGGISVGGLANNRKQFNALLDGTEHLPHTYNADCKFVRGLPDEDTTLADKLQEIIALRGANTIAGVIVEPIAGSAGVIVPPKGYLQRLREICDEHDILLIFDEVITAFGRIGDVFAAKHWGVVPDIITIAKGLTSGAAPMGGVIVSDDIHETLMTSTDGIELFHGYTYSAHPIAVAGALAALEIYQQENLFNKAITLGYYWQEKIHALKNLPNVIDIRNYGLMGAIDLNPMQDRPGQRGFDVFNEAFFNQDALIRVTGDTLAFSPPLIVEKSHIDELFNKITKSIENTNQKGGQ